MRLTRHKGKGESSAAPTKPFTYLDFCTSRGVPSFCERVRAEEELRRADSQDEEYWLEGGVHTVVAGVLRHALDGDREEGTEEYGCHRERVRDALDPRWVREWEIACMRNAVGRVEEHGQQEDYTDGTIIHLEGDKG